MPQAELSSITSHRRALCVGAAAAMTVLLTPAIAAPLNADASLLTLCRQFDADSLALDHFANRTAELYAANPKLLSLGDCVLDVLLDRWHSTMARIIPIPASTVEGIRAKARALGHALTQKVFVDSDRSFEEQAEDYERLAMSLVRDLAMVTPLEEARCPR